MIIVVVQLVVKINTLKHRSVAISKLHTYISDSCNACVLTFASMLCNILHQSDAGMCTSASTTVASLMLNDNLRKPA